MKIKLIFLCLFSFLVGVGVANATNYILSYNSVDNGEIRWGGTTKYLSHWNSAISIWNGMGKINIIEDTWDRYEDLTVTDIYNSNVTWSGAYRKNQSFGSDDIELNKYFLDGDSYAGDFTYSEIRHTILHEMGHSLGLQHHGISNNVMRSGKWDYGTLGTQDKKDYNYLWE